MKTIGIALLLAALCGCRTHQPPVDLLQIHQQRSAQLGNVTVPPPQTIPFEAKNDRKVYLEQYSEGFKSGMTGISICPLFAANLPHRNAHIKGWYSGQADGLIQSPWGMRGLIDTNGTPNQASQAIGAPGAPQPER